MVFGHCCLTGSFQLADCFAEMWTKTTARAVAYVGASHNTYWSEDDLLQRREFDWLAANPAGSVGGALDDALRRTAAVYPRTAEYYFTIYHVFGDPTVRLLGSAISLNHKPLVDTGDAAGPYLVEVGIAAPAGVQTAMLLWRTDPEAGFAAVPLAPSRDAIYSAVIPGQPYGTRVQYYVAVTDNAGGRALSPVDAPDALHTFRVEIGRASCRERV